MGDAVAINIIEVNYPRGLITKANAEEVRLYIAE